MKALLKQFNLPNYLKGDSFAKDSKRIQDRYKDSSSRDDKQTEMELLDRLRQAQEFVKGQQAPQVPQNQMGGGGPQPGQEPGFDWSQMQGPAVSGAGMLANTAGDIMSQEAQQDSGRINVAEETGAQALKGAAMGAAVGSIVPGVGTAIGAGVGSVAGAAKGFFSSRKTNEAIDDREIEAGQEQFRGTTNRFALGGTPCGGQGQPPCPDKLGQEDIVKINADENAPLQFSTDEYGEAAMNTLFQPAPPPIQKANVDYGKYGPVNYFQQDPSDATGLTLMKGSGQIHNKDAIKRQFGNIQALNPNIKLKYNALGGQVTDMTAYSGGQANQFFSNGGQATGELSGEPCGGPGQPPCKKEEKAGVPSRENFVLDSEKEPSNSLEQLLSRDISYLGTPENTPPNAGKPKGKAIETKTKGIHQSGFEGKELRDYAQGVSGARKGIAEYSEDIPEDINIKPQHELETEAKLAESELRKLNFQEFMQNNGSNALTTLARSAPTIANAIQLAKLKKPKAEGYARSNARYKKTPVDEQALQNLVKEQTSGTMQAILSSSGGSGSAARANLLGSQLQGTKALSDAYLKASGENRAESGREQQFNLGVDQMNISQANRETLAAAQNQGAYDTQKSKLMAQLGTDIGQMGKEALFKKYPELMGLDFDALGKYIKEQKSKK